MRLVGHLLFYHKQVMIQVYKEHQVNLLNVLLQLDVIVQFVYGSKSSHKNLYLKKLKLFFLENKMMDG